MDFADKVATNALKERKKNGNYYIPKVYGFAIYGKADYYQYRLRQGSQPKKSTSQTSNNTYSTTNKQIT